jgi:hypothetical protein
VGETELNKLYEYDYSLLSSLADMANDAQTLKAAVNSDNKASIKECMVAMAARMETFEATFKRRTAAVTGMEA